MTAAPIDPGLERDRERVDAALARVLTLPDQPRRVADPMRYAVQGGGKRMRPILCVAGYRAFRPEVPDPVFDLAAATELIHAYSLVHDDLPAMDDDDTRRGRAATHVAFGVAVAAAAGAALIPLAFRTVALAGDRLGLEPDVRCALIAALAAAAGAGGMIGGQVLDLEAEGRAVTGEELDRIHAAKTGALLGGAVRIGGIAAGASGAALDALGRYGDALGLAFQIMDDILDRTATTAALGKTAGKDAAHAKATFPGMAGLEAARDRALREVDRARYALDAAGIESDELRALARYAVERDR